MTITHRYKDKDLCFMERYAESIKCLENHDPKPETLRNMIYCLCVYAFRSYHNAGFPVNNKYPGLNSPAKKWSKVLQRFVDERYLEVLEREALA